MNGRFKVHSGHMSRGIKEEGQVDGEEGGKTKGRVDG